jgi:hypothetical protein
MQAASGDLKYVIVYSFGLELPVASPDVREHRELVGHASTVVSAGFFRFVPDEAVPGRMKVIAFGYSESTERSSRGEQDARILEQHFLPWQQDKE